MSTTTSKYDEMISEFQSEWEGSNIDLMETAMMMDGAARLYKTFFGTEPNSDQVIALSRVIAKNRLRTAMHC